MKLRLLVTAACAAIALNAATLSSAAAQEIRERTIKFGHLVATEHPIAVGVRRFGELVAQKSGGKIKVREFGSSVLGSEQQQQSALQGGTQEMFAPATTSVVGIVKELGLFDLPFGVSTAEQAYALMDGPLGQHLLDKLPARNLVGLTYWENGFRNVTNSRRPIQKLEDLSGLKMRVIANPVFLESFKALGVNPVPMAFGELYGALESRAVDAQENPYPVLLSAKFYEVQKYVSNTNHVYSPIVVLVSKKFWDQLTPTEQKILREAANESRDFQRAASREYSAKALGELKAKGMQVNDLAPAEMARLQAAVKPVTEKFGASYEPETLKLYMSELDRIRK
ncbi:TRAP transporter substrate-binding protein [Hydrogenophaga sp.]|uniref:TRAP transporter substrate-binding protein n=1 Tax=Hydrogenophaga sp. TaxID=1904254 RepID=UPI00261B83C3|nr:TRAP transporter substrate-binding protein [Hydrogenophaga sp.]MCW5653026.1 TRAP transporter substrate-binding protein [Hydrogenophaga sp.]